MHWSAFCIAISPDEPATVFFNGEKAKTKAEDEWVHR
ncbi:hypothetical protein E2C01_069563 [Portunus trituberculatus]|uniref:Uncharacterized protein n=1 Tax=Portunus trituberculatus TaxID=210409 RepID=A0A5B7HZX1_PORTR|nr:hypothetical protein [Portunus trituberculatus]